MNSGTVPLFWSARTFVEFMWVSVAGEGKHYIPYLTDHPEARFGGAKAFVEPHAPTTSSCTTRRPYSGSRPGVGFGRSPLG